jgi:hypothetical protein
MVRSICINKISEYIEREKLKPMKMWSNRFRYDSKHQKSNYLIKLTKQIRTLLELTSGNDVVEMLKGEITIHFFSYIEVGRYLNFF